MKYFKNIFILTLVSLLLVQCSSINHLGEYDFDDVTVAAIMSAPPEAEVFSEDFFDDSSRGWISTIIRIGTSIAKEVQNYKAQEKLDNAMMQIDVPEHIRVRALESTAKHLRFRAIDSTKEADFTLSMQIERYGINANSWNSAVEFKIEVDVQLIDNDKHRLIWEKDIDEEQPVTGAMFGLGTSASNIFTAAALSNLSEEEMVAGFTNLAAYIADRIAEKINDDYIDSHSKE